MRSALHMVPLCEATYYVIGIHNQLMGGAFCVTVVATTRSMNLERTTGDTGEVWAFQQVIYALFALLDRYSPLLDE